jgi:hypothetical protein
MNIKYKTEKLYGIIGSGIAISKVIRKMKSGDYLVDTPFGETIVVKKQVIEVIKEKSK